MSNIEPTPVDYGRLFSELPADAPAGWEVRVLSDESGRSTGIAVTCADQQQHENVHHKLRAGLYGPVAEDGDEA